VRANGFPNAPTIIRPTNNPKVGDPAVVALCQAQGVDAAQVLCAIKTRWDGNLEPNKGKRTGTALLVALADATAGPNAGKLLRQATDNITQGRFAIGEDEALTLIADGNGLYAEERLWFASPNLRLRTSILKQADGFSTASFCSEIRMGGAPPAA
jgi:hypothetical protein